ncbi:hypothetical protein F4778DRAFT_371279 [Xylariomycetidae sp. FL2044]|nr:hypothetical protein F4778DRAFT_371279 [Xylariomycetidae sp. FL2044]
MMMQLLMIILRLTKVEFINTVLLCLYLQIIKVVDTQPWEHIHIYHHDKNKKRDQCMLHILSAVYYTRGISLGINYQQKRITTIITTTKHQNARSLCRCENPDPVGEMILPFLSSHLTLLSPSFPGLSWFKTKPSSDLI